MTVTALRSRYLNDSVTTATPAQLLVMLYDRLVLDLNHAEKALRESDRGTATSRLMHAQEIVMELRVTLDATVYSCHSSFRRIGTASPSAVRPSTSSSGPPTMKSVCTEEMFIPSPGSPSKVSGMPKP